MRKSIFTLTIFVSLLLLSSIVSAQSRLIFLDTISNFFNQIFLKIFGVVPTTVIKEKTIQSSGSIVQSRASYIDITEVPNGIVPKLTWGANLLSSSSNTNFLYDGLPKSGITLGRIDMDLNYIFPTSTSLPQFNRLDTIISDMRNNNIEPLLVVDYSPSWLGKSGSKFDPPSDMAKYNQLVSTVINHVKDSVTYYEIWNEPDNQKFWTGTDTEYGSLLRNVSQVIRSTDPSTKILAPASSDAYFKDVNSQRYKILKESCTNANSYFDIISFHLYTYSQISLSSWKSEMDDFVQKLKQLRCEKKPLWMTESGIWTKQLSRDNRDVMLVAKFRKGLLDYNVSAQVYYPFLNHTDLGTDLGLYDYSTKLFSNIGKYYQLMSQLKFYGDNLTTVSNVQNDIGGISYLAVKNPDNKILIQLTNNFSTSNDVQINFVNVKDITVYESNSSQIFSPPTVIGQKSSFVLSLKPYSVYLIEAK
jgi:O-glycosyl hydrolase